MSLAIALLVASADVPDFLTAQERWVCQFHAFGSEEQVKTYFGVFRSHVEDDWGQGATTIQNDSDALVFAYSDIGNTDISGGVRKWVRIDIIDKKTNRFKRSIIDVAEPKGASDQAVGECRRY